MNVDKSRVLVETDSLITLGTARGKMEVAQEELRQQNSELAVAVSALEADRKRDQEALHESEERFRWCWCQSIFVKALHSEGIIEYR